jgi:hypothetical protein
VESQTEVLRQHVGPEALKAVVRNSLIFGDMRVMQYGLLKVNRRGCPCSLLHARFSLGLIVDTEDGGDMFLLNVEWISTEYNLLYYRRWESFLRSFQKYCEGNPRKFALTVDESNDVNCGAAVGSCEHAN